MGGCDSSEATLRSLVLSPTARNGVCGACKCSRMHADCTMHGCRLLRTHTHTQASAVPDNYISVGTLINEPLCGNKSCAVRHPNHSYFAESPCARRWRLD